MNVGNNENILTASSKHTFDNMDRYKILRLAEVRGRDRRIQQQKEARIDKRMQALAEHRNISSDNKPIPQPAPKKKSRTELLKEYKEKKENLKKLSKAQKKPAFIVGKVRYKASGSPLQAIHNRMPKVVRAGAVTRSQTKDNDNKKVETIASPRTKSFKFLTKVDGEKFSALAKYKFVTPVVLNTKLTIPISPNITKSKRKAKPIIIDKSIAKLIPKNFFMDKKENEMTTQVPIQPSIEKVTAEVPETADSFVHLLYSPSVEKRRGSSMRRSKQLKFFENVESEIKHEEDMKNSRIAAFRLFLINESKRLLSLATTWQTFVSENQNVPSDVEGEVNAVVGKTKLLTSDKFKQFEGLVNKCDEDDPTVKVDDLQGFHDWVMLEVEDLNKAYFQLQERRDNNWKEKVCETNLGDAKPQKKVAPLKKIVPKKPVAASSIRAHILAARKKMNKETDAAEVAPIAAEIAPVSSPSTCHGSTEKTAPTSASRSASSLVETPRQKTLLMKVLRKRCSGLEIMAANAAVRSLTPGKSPLSVRPDEGTPVTPTRTPRSILRKTTQQSDRKTVNFPVNIIDPSYLEPVQNSPSEDSPDVIKMAVDDSLITNSIKSLRKRSISTACLATPSRRSERIAHRGTSKV